MLQFFNLLAILFLAHFTYALEEETTRKIIEVQGHRGARGLLPENTIPSFAKAISLGVDAIELDVGLTKDGAVVVSHEELLSARNTRQSGLFLSEDGPSIFSLTYKELLEYDVGRLNPNRPYSKQFPEQTPVDGTQIPTLQEVFDLVKKMKNEDVLICVEIKTDPTLPELTADVATITDAVIAEIKKARLCGRVRLLAFDWRVLQYAQKIAPELPTVYLTKEDPSEDTVCRNSPSISPWLAGLQIRDYQGSLPRMVKAAGGSFWSPYYPNLTDEDIAVAKEIGLPIIVWTINEDHLMRHFIDKGVKGIVTDYPDLLIRILEETK